MWYLSTAGISLIFTIIVCRYSRDANAAAQQCMITGSNIRCIKLSFGKEFTIPCSEDLQRNGVPLNETDKAFAIRPRSPADYGVYTCSSDDGIVQYVIPDDCDGKCTSITIAHPYDDLVNSSKTIDDYIASGYDSSNIL